MMVREARRSSVSIEASGDAKLLVMSEMGEVPDTWTTRHFPVLRSVVVRYETHGQVTSEEVVQDTGLSELEVDRAARDLRDEGLIAPYFEGGGGFVVMGGPMGDARRLVGAWPSPETFADRLMEAVERGMEDASTSEERSRWKAVRDALTGAGRDIVVNAAAIALGGAASGLG